MMPRAKEVLVRHHIGTIIVALIVLQGVAQIAGLLLWPLQMAAVNTYNRVQKGSALAMPLPAAPPGPVIALYLFQAVLLLAIAYLLARWLYKEEPPTEEEADSAA